MKNKKTIILLIVSVLFVSGFLLLNKTSSVKQIKLKELNYNVTYKEAFPNSNIRKSIILCIMRNRCGEEQYNSGMYTVEKYNAQHPGTYNTYIQYYMTREYANNSMFGPTISEAEIEAKENETISKEDLDKIKILIPNEPGETIRNLGGIEYLKNLKVLCNFKLDVENLDLSHNKELETILFNTDSSSEISKIKKIIVEEDNKLKLLALELENETLDISNLKTLEVVILKNGNIKNIVLPNNIKKLDLAFNKISSIVLPEGVEDVNLDANLIENIKIPSKVIKANISRNKISSIDLSDAIKLERLESRFNPIESIDLTKSVNLKFIELYRANIKSKTIDFSHNPKLEIASLNYIMPMPPIYGRPPLPEPPMRLETLDFSNNPNLIGINAEKIGLKSIDLSKNLKLTYANINNNEIKDLKIPTTLKRNSIQNINFKIKKNSYIDLPILFNGEKVYLEDSDNFKRVNDKYIFDQVGTFNEKVKKEITDGYKYEANVTVEVESGEEETYTPTLTVQKDYKPEANKKLSVDKIKEMVTNLPANIKNFEVLSQNTFTDKGDKTVKVRITFSDDTFKEVDIPVKVYEKEDILPTVNVTPETLEILDKKSFNINITRFYAKEDNIDNTNFIKTVRDNLVSYEYLNKANGLTYNLNGIAGVIDYLFTGSEEEHTFNITYKEKGNIYTFNKNVSIKLLRDTDKDGIPDKDDDDKDGDGFSNAVEIARGSDPYNKDSLPDMSKKDELDNLVKQLEKLIEDTKNNPFDTKNKLDVDNLKNNFLPDKVIEKDNIKGSYSATTSDSDLLKLIEKTKKEIDDIKKEINKLRDKANFEELEKEIEKDIDEDFYLEDTVKVLKDKIKEAKDMSKDTSTQEEVDEMTKVIKKMRSKLSINKTKLKEKIKDVEEVIDSGKYNEEEFQKLLKQAKDLYNKDSFTKKEMLDMIEKLDDLLNRKGSFINPNTGIKTYSLVILFIIFVSYLVFKKHKNYIR